MKIVELILDESGELGVEALSAVEYPAIESNFITLSADQKLLKDYKVELKAVNEEKRILMGPALIPNKLIYRNDEQGEYYIYFSKETVKKASQLFLKAGNQNNATVEHERIVEGMHVVESWIKEDAEKDKSAIYGLTDPVGTWMVSMKAENDEVWELAKQGKVKGFSVEAFFADKYQTKEPILNKQPDEDLQAMLDFIKEILQDE
jgi:hypothetical protein